MSDFLSFYDGQLVEQNASPQMPFPVGTSFDSLGRVFPLDSCSLAYVYSGTNISTITATAPANLGGLSWVQTFTYNGSLIASQSQWVRTT